MNPAALAVLRSIADDYEQFDYVVGEVTKSVILPGMESPRDEIRGLLEGLVMAGHAQVFELSEKPPYEKAVPFTVHRIHELWFYATASGKKLVEES